MKFHTIHEDSNEDHNITIQVAQLTTCAVSSVMIKTIVSDCNGLSVSTNVVHGCTVEDFDIDPNEHEHEDDLKL